jgi:heme-degrading monooxygenase HmoA
MSQGRVHVLLYARPPQSGAGAVEDAYHRISASLAGTPGLVGNRLMREVGGDGFVVMSEWESIAAFQQWESGPTHRDTTSPLRPYQDRSRGRPFGIYEVVAAYG